MTSLICHLQQKTCTTFAVIYLILMQLKEAVDAH